MWKRPTALALTKYATAWPQELTEHYYSDNEAAKTAGVKIPCRPTSSSSSSSAAATTTTTTTTTMAPSVLRVAQWNVHYFVNDEGFLTMNPIFDELMKHNADVIVLNEFCADDPTEHAALIHRMKRSGYMHQKVADISYPIALFVRMDEVDHVEDIRLSAHRKAVVMRLTIPSQSSSSSSSSSSTTTPAQSSSSCSSSSSSSGRHKRSTNNSPPASRRHLWLYATHLNDKEITDGHRRSEMQTLLNHVKAHADTGKAADDDDGVLIVGDFNQQRKGDYLDEEWERIKANMECRDIRSFTDGVDELLASHGFACVWDAVPPDARNWPSHEPPPATHWSGTVIDYVYSKGRHVQNVGAYVSPSGLSDHRLIVTDWQV